MKKIKYDSNNKYHLKLDRKYWVKYLSGVKVWEFRKLIKGLTSGKYYFFDMKSFEFLGTADLKPINVNQKLWSCKGDCRYYQINGRWSKCSLHKRFHKDTKVFEFGLSPIYAVGGEWEDFKEIEGDVLEIDKDTYNFVKVNYVDKNICFIVYSISNVKENK